jgi:AcrR family transcriptional regulator
MTRTKAKPPRKNTSKKVPRTKAEQRAETLEQILDAAEFLFSKHGLYGVTLRDVALKVGVHTSLMHYYFEDKPTVEDALHVFLDTDFDLYIEGDEGLRNYAAFCAQLANTPEGAELFDRHFDPVVLKLIAILKKALPEVSKRDIFWGYHFVTGSFMHALARSGRIDRLSGGLCKSDDLKAVKARLADFLAAGFGSFEKPKA